MHATKNCQRFHRTPGVSHTNAMKELDKEFAKNRIITKSLSHVTVHRGLGFSHCLWDLISFFFNDADTPLITKIPLIFLTLAFLLNANVILCYESLESFRFVFIEWYLGNQFLLLKFFDSFTRWSLKGETVFVLGMKIIKQNKITSMPSRHFPKYISQNSG